MSQMSQFGIQFNKNSFGLTCSAPLQIASLPPNQSTTYSLPLAFTGPIQKMEPLDTLQVRIFEDKNENLFLNVGLKIDLKFGKKWFCNLKLMKSIFTYF